MNINSNITKKKGYPLLYYIFATCNILSFMNKEILFVYRNWMLVILLPVLVALSFMQNKGIIKGTRLIVAAIAALSFAFYLFGSKGIGSMLNLLLLCELVTCFPNVRWQNKEIIYTGICCMVLNLYYFTKSIGYTATYYLMISANESATEINPNIIGLILLFSCMITCISFKNIKREKMKFILIALNIAIAFTALLRFSCRGSIIALVFFVIASYLIPTKFYSKGRLNFIFWIVVLMSLLIPIVYLGLYKNHFSYDVFNMGKNFYSGREVIWNQFFEYAKENPFLLLVGFGSKNEYLSDMHNALLGLIVNYGLIVTILVYILLFKTYNKIVERSINEKSVVCCIAFNTIMIASWTECTITFSSSYFYYAICLAWGVYYSQKGEYLTNENNYCL